MRTLMSAVLPPVAGQIWPITVGRGVFTRWCSPWVVLFNCGFAKTFGRYSPSFRLWLTPLTYWVGVLLNQHACAEFWQNGVLDQRYCTMVMLRYGIWVFRISRSQDRADIDAGLCAVLFIASVMAVSGG